MYSSSGQNLRHSHSFELDAINRHSFLMNHDFMICYSVMFNRVYNVCIISTFIHRTKVTITALCIPDGIHTGVVSIFDTEKSPYMNTGTLALTGFINVCTVCKEFPNVLIIYSLGNPPIGTWCDGGLFYCPPAINQHKWETLPRNGCLLTVCTWALPRPTVCHQPQ